MGGLGPGGLGFLGNPFQKKSICQVAKLSTVDVQAGHQARGTTTEKPGWRHGATKDLNVQPTDLKGPKCLWTQVESSLVYNWFLGWFSLYNWCFENITVTKAYISHVDSPWSVREKTFLKWKTESAMFAYPKWCFWKFQVDAVPLGQRLANWIWHQSYALRHCFVGDT